ncbi:hypothetical protein DPMN_121430 [Dreissena polymorpha]|uniref:Uncharacterized protein n=1 Tax=Dreissena polymorpha TaxID=45954 RepID=A0A9D4GMS9_DREPO|nr:hypothetical protein DPMN_121430 [Dreissena polymorpha]
MNLNQYSTKSNKYSPYLYLKGQSLSLRSNVCFGYKSSNPDSKLVMHPAIYKKLPTYDHQEERERVQCNNPFLTSRSWSNLEVSFFCHKISFPDLIFITHHAILRFFLPHMKTMLRLCFICNNPLTIFKVKEHIKVKG